MRRPGVRLVSLAASAYGWSVASTAEVESTTRDVIAEFCRYGQLFTALDVSNEVKVRITGVRHREVSPVVRSIYEAGDMDSDYTRTTIDVDIGGGRKAQAFLYHEQHRDPGDYGQHERAQRAAPVTGQRASSSSVSAQNTSTNAAPPPAPKPSAPGPAAADPGGNEMDLTVLADGSARIPRSFMVRAGVSSDEVALDSAGFGAGLRLIEYEDDEDEDEPLDVLEYERGDQLRLPAAFLSGFGAGTIRARAEIGIVYIESN